jgi:bla regulator protein BlaR1
MSSIVENAVLTIARSAELSVVVKATIVLVVMHLSLYLASRTTASLRHLILAATFGTLLMLPIMTVVLPTVAVPLAATPPALLGRPVVGTTVAPVERSAQDAADTNEDVPPTPPARSSVPLTTVVQAGWILGVVLFLVPIAVSLAQLRRLRRCARLWLGREPLIQTLATEVGIRRPVRVLLHEDIRVPITCGFARPSVIFPADAAEWSDADIRRAIVHELEHVRRADWLVHLTARFVCAAYWFHVLVWIAWRRLCLEAERACDDAVLNSTQQTDYADQLVRLARRLRDSSPHSALSMASRSDLADRIAAVLDSNQPRGRARISSVLASTVTAAIVVLAVSPLTAVATSGPRDQPVPANQVSLAGVGLIEPGPATQFPSASTPVMSPGHVLAQTTSILQASDVAPLTFIAASVKRNPAGMRSLHRGPIIDGHIFLESDLSGTEITFTGAALRWLIMFAYQVNTYRVLGGPDWMNAGPYGEYFDIEAKAAAPASWDQFRLMMRRLLAERFNLVVRMETRDVPIYELVVADPNGTLGPNLHQATTDCATLRAAAGPDLGRTGIPCGIKLQAGHLAARGMAMDQVAGWLSRNAGRPVVDKTGLGIVDWELTFTPEPLRHHPPDRFPQVDPDGPSLLTALQEQLGLKLEPQEPLGDVLVIDHVEQPRPD